MTDVRLSLVIPAFNEQAILPRLLRTVDVARDRYTRGRDAIEVIVADNCSTDDTAAIAERMGCRVVRVETRNIGAVRNGGAREARGELLCFVDADGQVHPDVFNAADEALSSGRYSVGATGVRMERMSLGIACTWLVLVPMVVLTGIDTGLVFCRRSDFEAVGGYDEQRPAGEDVCLHLSLMRLGKPRRQGAVRLPHVKGISSTRKFDEHGDWHYFRILRDVPRLMLDPTHRSDWMMKYWYPDRR